jgi:phthalate 4,5-cis-dihydrodiol dehydrogenase
MAATRTQAGKAQPTKGHILKIGVVGMGVGAAEILPAMESMPEVQLVAGADINPRVREAFSQRYHIRAYDSVEKLCADPEVDAVWVSTPNKYHAPHTIIAAQHGKHVVVEKPMAISLQEAEAMIEACDKNKVKLLCGHTMSYSAPVRAMYRIIKSGELGKARAINIWSYSDWMLRPRTAEELNLAEGGGIPYRQGPHQIDTIRLLGGGMLRSVRAMTGDWFKERTIPGYYGAYMEFEDGTPSIMVHNGYGYFNTNDLVAWGTERQRYTPEERVAIRKAMRTGSRKEDQDKDDMRIGGRQEFAIFARGGERKPWLPTDLGVVVVSCDRGDIRHSPYGVYVYGDDGKRDVPVGEGAAMRREELEELYNAVAMGGPVHHSGRWGMATLEVCLVIMQSARERREVMLKHQVPTPADYG